LTVTAWSSLIVSTGVERMTWIDSQMLSNAHTAKGLLGRN